MNSAGVEIGQGVVFKLDTNACPVERGADGGAADRFDLPDLAPSDGSDQINVVNHDVEDDADIKAAEGKSTEAGNIDESRFDVFALNGGPCRVESLDVPDHQYRIILSSEPNHISG